MATKVLSLLGRIQQLFTAKPPAPKLQFFSHNLSSKPFKAERLVTSKLLHTTNCDDPIISQLKRTINTSHISKVSSQKLTLEPIRVYSDNRNNSPLQSKYHNLYQLNQIFYTEKLIGSSLTTLQFWKKRKEYFSEFNRYCTDIFNKSMTLSISSHRQDYKGNNFPLEKSGSLELSKIREAILPEKKEVSPINYFLSAPLNEIYLHHLSCALSHDFFTPGYKPTYLKVAPTMEFKKAFKSLIFRLRDLNCGLKDSSVILLRLLEFGPWNITITNSELKIWLPNSFNSFSTRQFLRDIGMGNLLTRVSIGNTHYSPNSEEELQAQLFGRQIASQKFTSQKEPTVSYRQELLDFMNILEISRGSLGQV